MADDIEITIPAPEAEEPEAAPEVVIAPVIVAGGGDGPDPELAELRRRIEEHEAEHRAESEHRAAEAEAAAAALAAAVVVEEAVEEAADPIEELLEDTDGIPEVEEPEPGDSMEHEPRFWEGSTSSDYWLPKIGD